MSKRRSDRYKPWHPPKEGGYIPKGEGPSPINPVPPKGPGSVSPPPNNDRPDSRRDG